MNTKEEPLSAEAKLRLALLISPIWGLIFVLGITGALTFLPFWSSCIIFIIASGLSLKMAGKMDKWLKEL